MRTTSGDTEISEPNLNSSGDLTVDSLQPMDFKNGDETSSRVSSPAQSKATMCQPLDMSDVYLFVEEIFDRMVPISKQPKDKIQAITEATYRQFPELHERSRK